jgi:hypothetical protein
MTTQKEAKSHLIQQQFIEAWNALAKDAHTTAKSKGWNARRSDGESIALCHTELSEALEALRHGNPPDDKIPEFDGASAELGDTVIRIMHFGRARKFKVGEAIVAKMTFNKSRPVRHGGKKF